MTDDLVKRLRDVGRDYDFHENALVYSAADRIEALTAENEKLRAALKELADLMDDVCEGHYKPDSFTTQPARAALGGTQ